MKRFKNLKFRLIAGLSVFLFVIFYLFGFFLIESLKKNYLEGVNTSVLTALKDIHHEYHIDLNNTHEFEEVKHEFAMDVLYVQVVMQVGDKITIVAKSKDLGTHSLNFTKNLTSATTKDILIDNQHITGLTQKYIRVATRAFYKDENESLYLQCAVPYNKHSDSIEQIKILLIIGLVSLLGIILGVVYWMLSRSLMSVKDVVVQVKQIAIDGQKHSLVKTEVSLEIDELISTFNTLLNELQTSYKKLKEFGQNASHELKTPLTIMRGEIEIGLRKERSLQEYQTILASILDEVNILQDTIEKILFLSSHSDSEIVGTFGEVYLDEVVADVMTEKMPLIKLKSLQISIDKLEPTNVIGNAMLLKIVFANLLDNAIKYSHMNGEIKITLQDHQLIIEDCGVGIEASDLPRVFERFYREDKVRNHASGSGLGLSLVKTILDIHGFKITITSQKNQGTKVAVICL